MVNEYVVDSIESLNILTTLSDSVTNVLFLIDIDTLDLSSFIYLYSVRFANILLFNITFPNFLKNIVFFNCEITDEQFISGLSNLKELQQLEINYCPNITNTGINTILGQFTTLQTIILDTCSSITILNLPDTVQEITINNCQIESYTLPKEIIQLSINNSAILKDLQQLQILSLENYTDPDYSFLQNNTQLISLTLDSCHITDDDFVYIQKLEKLQSIIINNCQISNRGLVYFPTTIQEITFENCENIMNDSMYLLPTGLLNLSLLSCINITAIETLPNISYLYLQDFTENPIMILRTMDSIIQLYLNNSNSEQLQYLPPRLQQLSIINFLYNNLDVLTLESLQQLELNNCQNITDKEFSYIQQLINLQSLYLYYCQQITDQGIQTLTNLKNLQFLCVMGCSNITAEISNLLPNVQIKYSP